MSQFHINEEAISAKAIIAKMNASMMQAAEPMIQKALAEIEAEMRRSLAANTIAMIERATRFEIMRDEVVIVLQSAVNRYGVKP